MRIKQDIPHLAIITSWVLVIIMTTTEVNKGDITLYITMPKIDSTKILQLAGHLFL